MYSGDKGTTSKAATIPPISCYWEVHSIGSVQNGCLHTEVVIDVLLGLLASKQQLGMLSSTYMNSMNSAGASRLDSGVHLIGKDVSNSAAYSHGLHTGCITAPSPPTSVCPSSE